MPQLTLEHIHAHLLDLKRGQDEQTVLMRRTFRKVGKIMAVADDIKAALADISAETTAETDLLTAIDTKMTGLSDQITALEKQVADGDYLVDKPT
jgi:predicted  nucleic acid-binding Zn-ribbon protein